MRETLDTHKDPFAKPNMQSNILLQTIRPTLSLSQHIAIFVFCQHHSLCYLLYFCASKTQKILLVT